MVFSTTLFELCLAGVLLSILFGFSVFFGPFCRSAVACSAGSAWAFLLLLHAEDALDSVSLGVLASGLNVIVSLSVYTLFLREGCFRFGWCGCPHCLLLYLLVLEV
jgi:hypothetical protein